MANSYYGFDLRIYDRSNETITFGDINGIGMKKMLHFTSLQPLGIFLKIFGKFQERHERFDIG